jgi:hypothetical protein
MCPFVEVNDLPSSAIADLAVDTAAVYWTQGDRLVSHNLMTKNEIPLTTGQTMATSLANDGQGHLYWTDVAATTMIRSISTSGGTPTDRAQTTGTVAALAASSSAVYWIESDTGLVLPSTTPLTLASNAATGKLLGIDAAHVYWGVNSQSVVYELTLGQMSPVTLASGLAPVAMGVGATSLFVGAGDGFIYRVPILQGKATQVLSDKTSFGQIAVDQAYIYWTTQADNRVMRAPLDGSSTLVLAVNQASPKALVIGDTAVYWLTSDGHVRSVPK